MNGLKGKFWGIVKLLNKHNTFPSILMHGFCQVSNIRPISLN